MWLCRILISKAPPKNHPLTHISPLPELPRIAGAFYKDGDLLETQPDGFGARFAVVSAGEEAAALGNQA